MDFSSCFFLHKKHNVFLFSSSKDDFWPTAVCNTIIQVLSARGDSTINRPNENVVRCFGCLSDRSASSAHIRLHGNRNVGHAYSRMARVSFHDGMVSPAVPVGTQKIFFGRKTAAFRVRETFRTGHTGNANRLISKLLVSSRPTMTRDNRYCSTRFTNAHTPQGDQTNVPLRNGRRYRT